MTPEQIAGIAQQAVLTLLWISTPIMVIGLVVGLIIALFQALTSIQEITLTFVPKIIIVFASLIILIPYMSAIMNDMSNDIFRLIAISGDGGDKSDTSGTPEQQ